jgi:p-cumate 2,3-dioxygenase beta subunit
MTATVPVNVREAVVDFLTLEAALLDRWQLDEWLELWTSDGRYVIPTNDNPDADPANDLMFVNHDLRLLRGLVVRLKSARAHREYPWSTTRHIVTNVRILGEDAGDLLVEAAFMVWRFRNADRDCYVGRYDYRLLPDGNSFKIRGKHITLDAWTLAPMGAISIIL